MKTYFRCGDVCSVNRLCHLHGALLGAAEAAHDQVAVLKHEVSGCSVVKVQVSQDIAVMVQHAGPECSIDARAALLTLSCAGSPSTQRQVCRYLTPADSQAFHCVSFLFVIWT